MRLQGQREVRGHQRKRGAVPRRSGPRDAPQHRRHLLRGRVDLRGRPAGLINVSIHHTAFRIGFNTGRKVYHEFLQVHLLKPLRSGFVSQRQEETDALMSELE